MHAGLAQELTQLRRGQGLHSEDVVLRIGEELRLACSIGPDEDPATVRRKLIDRISVAVETLPPDLRLAVQASLALSPAAQHRFLKDRMIWLGAQIDRDPRTAARRALSGFTLLAERITGDAADPAVATNEYAPDGWYVDRLRATLRLTTDPVQLLEERIIVATKDGLDEVAVSWSVPKAAALPEGARVEADLIYGGDLVRSEELSTPTYWTGRIRLPRPLRAGEQHEYHVRVTTVARRYFRPYYVLSPYRRCDEFDLRVKFDPQDLPERIWRLGGVPHRMVDEGLPRDPEVRVDSVGEVMLQFSNLRQGLSYGLQWTPLGKPSSQEQGIESHS